MKEITILSHHLGIQGSYLNILDLNNYLQSQKYSVLFYASEWEDLFKVTRGSKRLHEFSKLELLKNYKPDLNATVITDFKTLIKLFELKIHISCKKFIIMDNNELSYHLNDIKQSKFYHYGLNIYEILSLHHYQELLFLIPPSNVSEFKNQYGDLPFKVFFKKINWNLLKDVPVDNIDKLYYRFDDIDNLKELEHKYGNDIITFNEYKELDLWDYKGLIYYRRKHLEYYEQLGRIIFEFIMLGKEVHFLKNPFEKEDGLSDYLRHYDIQFDENFKVITPAENLIDLMTMDYKFKPWSI